MYNSSKVSKYGIIYMADTYLCGIIKANRFDKDGNKEARATKMRLAYWLSEDIYNKNNLSKKKSKLNTTI